MSKVFDKPIKIPRILHLLIYNMFFSLFIFPKKYPCKLKNYLSEKLSLKLRKCQVIKCLIQASLLTSVFDNLNMCDRGIT